MSDFTEEIKAITQANMNSVVDEAIAQLQAMKVQTSESKPSSVDMGTYCFTCKLCQDEFYSSDTEVEQPLCQECSHKEVTKLQAEVTRLTEELTLARTEWPTSLSCDNCGDTFEPVQREIRVRRAFCSENCRDDMNGREYQKAHAPKRKHEAMPEAVKNSPVGLVARSEAQQIRRAVEKRECKWCGKPTAKLFCTDDCRKLSEKSVVSDSSWEKYADEQSYRGKFNVFN